MILSCFAVAIPCVCKSVFILMCAAAVQTATWVIWSFSFHFKQSKLAAPSRVTRIDCSRNAISDLNGLENGTSFMYSMSLKSSILESEWVMLWELHLLSESQQAHVVCIIVKSFLLSFFLLLCTKKLLLMIVILVLHRCSELYKS